MIEENQRKSKEKIELALQAIQEDVYKRQDVNTEFRESYKDLINAGVDSKTAQKAIKKAEHLALLPEGVNWERCV